MMRRNTIGMVLAAAAIFLLSFYYSSNVLIMGDDLCYSFSNLYEPNRLDSYTRITSFADIVESQVHDYFHENGRVPVQLTGMVFINLTGSVVFGIANSIMFLLLIYLTLRMSVPRRLSFSPVMWIALALVFWYLFPYSGGIRLGGNHDVCIYVNYLWASVGALWFLFTVMSGRCSRFGSVRFALALLLSVIVGWSHEAFALPLSGAMFFGLLIKRFRVSRRTLLMIIALWLGTIMVVFSPGNIERAVMRDSSTSLSGLLSGALHCFIHIRMLWIFMAVCAVLWFRRRGYLREFLRKNIVLILVAAVECVFAIYAHTSERTLTIVELVSLIMLLRMACDYTAKNPRAVTWMRSRAAKVAGVAVLCLVAAHQFMLIQIHSATMRNYRDMFGRYAASPDGVTMLAPVPDIDRWYISLFAFTENPFITPADYTAERFSLYYGNPGKYPLVLSPSDYRMLIENPDSLFSEKNRVPGTACAYKGADYYFIKSPMPAGKIVAYFGNDTDSLGLKKKFRHTVFGWGRGSEVLIPAEVPVRNGTVTVTYKTFIPPVRIDLE